MTTKVTLHGLDGAHDLLRDVVVPIYVAGHADHLVDPFYSVDRFLERCDAYSSREGFGLALARAGETPVGVAFGYPLPSGSRWWAGLLTEAPAGFTDEDGTRTFALNELMVAPEHQRQGVARQLVDTLLASRPEQRATLLVDPANAPAYAAYTSWGWRKTAQLRPFPDSPIYDSLLIDLKWR